MILISVHGIMQDFVLEKFTKLCLLFGLSFWVRPILYRYRNRNNRDFSIFFAQEVTVFEIVAGNIILVGLSLKYEKEMVSPM